MKILIQKVSKIKIFSQKKLIFDSKGGYLFYIGLEKGDELKNLNFIVEKIENLEIVDENGKFLRNLKQTRPNLFFISNITLISAFKNKKINFNLSLEPKLAKEIFDNLVFNFDKLGYNIFKVEFGSFLEVEASNIGPINFFLSF